MEIRQLERQAVFPYSYEASGDEIRYEGIDTPDKFSIQSNPPSATTHISVSGRSLGGGVLRWYSDEAGKSLSGWKSRSGSGYLYQYKISHLVYMES